MHAFQAALTAQKLKQCAECGSRDNAARKEVESMRHDEQELWQEYRVAFEQALEALKRDMLRIEAIRRELAELRSLASEQVPF